MYGCIQKNCNVTLTDLTIIKYFILSVLEISR